MGWRDRPYAHRDYDAHDTRGSRYRGSGLSGLSVVTTLIIVNIVVHFLTYSVSEDLLRIMWGWGVMQANAVLHGQVWRLLTATYLHSGFHHIFFNMLALYFFGPALERVWGPRQFFVVYTAGGIAGNILLTLAGLVGFIDPDVPAVGASGSVLALLGACAVLFPNAQVYVYFLFPIRIRTFVAIYGIWFLYNVWQQGANYGGDLCHLGGLAVGLWWAYSGGISLSGRHRTVVDPSSLLGKLTGRSARTPSGRDPGTGARWDETEQPPDEQEVDRILRKVHEQGLDSLTPEEKNTLIEASRRRR
jgi:membrane associated rhomboid family serine protease